MGKNAFKWLITATVTVAFTTSVWAQTVDPGQIEFLSKLRPMSRRGRKRERDQ